MFIEHSERRSSKNCRSKQRASKQQHRAPPVSLSRERSEQYRLGAPLGINERSHTPHVANLRPAHNHDTT